EGGDALPVRQQHGVELGAGEVADRPGAQRGVRGGGTVDGLVVHDHHLPVGAEVHIALQQLRPVLEGAAEGGEGVLRRMGGGAAVADDAGTRRGGRAGVRGHYSPRERGRARPTRSSQPEIRTNGPANPWTSSMTHLTLDRGPGSTRRRGRR